MTALIFLRPENSYNWSNIYSARASTFIAVSCFSIPTASQQATLKTLLSLHVRIPLMPETGIALIPGTHQRWDSQHETNVRLQRGPHYSSEHLPGAQLIPLNKGDLLIFNAQMIHRGHYAANRHRKALDLCFGRPHPLLTTFLDEQQLPQWTKW